jgi:hypothetical protein
MNQRVPLTETAPTSDFSWPDFDHWQGIFAAAGVVPPGWEGLQRPPARGSSEAESYCQRKLALFTEWLDMLSHRPAVWAHYSRRGIRVRVVRQDERAPCPACDRFNAREAQADMNAMPPFHPGCRCVLMAMPAIPDR